MTFWSQLSGALTADNLDDNLFRVNSLTPRKPQSLISIEAPLAKSKQRTKEWKLHNPYDKAARFAAKQGKVHFVRFIFPRLKIIIVLKGYLDTRIQSHPQLDDRTCDVVFILEDPENPDIIFILDGEFQAAAVGDELYRGKEYKSRYSRELNNPATCPKDKEYWVFVVFLFLTGKATKLVYKAKLEGTPLKDNQVLFGVAFEDFDAKTILDKIRRKKLDPSLLYWIPLMKGADQPDIVLEWKALVDELVLEPQRGDMKTVALTFAELAECGDIWKDTLRNWAMESALLKEWTEEARRETRCEERQGQLFKFLEKRLHATISASLRTRIQSEKDMAKLESWIDEAAYLSNSFSDFLARTGL